MYQIVQLVLQIVLQIVCSFARVYLGRDSLPWITTPFARSPVSVFRWALPVPKATRLLVGSFLAGGQATWSHFSCWFEERLPGLNSYS